MRGMIKNLSERLDISILAFREHRSEAGFYAPNIDKDFSESGLKWEKSGIFTNFYPGDDWFISIVNAYKNAEIPLPEVYKKRSDSVKNALIKCGEYCRISPEFPEIREATNSDGITYNSLMPGEEIKNAGKYDMTDPAFFLYATSKTAENARGDELSLTEKGKKLLLSMAFLEADMERAVKRKDTSVLYKRAKKCAELYLEYYYEGSPLKKEKGAVSEAYFKFSSTIFYLFGSNALQDDKFIV